MPLKNTPCLCSLFVSSFFFYLTMCAFNTAAAACMCSFTRIRAQEGFVDPHLEHNINLYLCLQDEDSAPPCPYATGVCTGMIAPFTYTLQYSGQIQRQHEVCVPEHGRTTSRANRMQANRTDQNKRDDELTTAPAIQDLRPRLVCSGYAVDGEDTCKHSSMANGEWRGRLFFSFFSFSYFTLALFCIFAFSETLACITFGLRLPRPMQRCKRKEERERKGEKRR